jgi:hypothetical protein
VDPEERRFAEIAAELAARVLIGLVARRAVAGQHFAALLLVCAGLVTELELLAVRPLIDELLVVVEEAITAWATLSGYLNDAWEIFETEPQEVGFAPLKGDRVLFVPDFTRRDVQAAATTPEALEHGQGLAMQVEDLDWDEYSLWGGLPGEGIGAGELLVHHTGRPLTGECPCPDGSAAGLCAHMVALASAYLGDDSELADRLAALSHGEVVALALELADRSAWARQAIWLSLDARGSR